MIAITAFIVAVIIVAYIGAWMFVVYLGVDMDEPIPAVIMAVALVALLLLGIGVIAGNSDNSKHCGPGTVYRESSRYDPATKQVRHDWVCEAN